MLLVDFFFEVHDGPLFDLHAPGVRAATGRPEHATRSLGNTVAAGAFVRSFVVALVGRVVLFVRRRCAFRGVVDVILRHNPTDSANATPG